MILGIDGKVEIATKLLNVNKNHHTIIGHPNTTMLIKMT
jgi:hypothetical protein